MSPRPTAFSRRWLLAAMASGAATAVLAEAPATSLRPMPRGTLPASPRRALPDAAGLIAAAGLGGATGFVVADTKSGQVLESVDGDLSLPPASVAKAITALYALERLGPGHRFVTRLLATGPVSGGTIRGDLVLAGSGDPTLSTDMLAEMARALAAAGVRGVTGRFLSWGGALPAVPAIDPDQPDHVGYNPALSGLNLNFNRVHFEWRRGAGGYELAMDARSERHVPRVSMARMRVIQRERPVYTYAAVEGADNWTVASGALGKGGSRWLPVRHPDAYAAEVFQTLARAQGIALPVAQPVARFPGGTVLVERWSDELSPLLRDMLRFSTNITAEAIGLTASGAASLPASGQAMADWLAAGHGVPARFRDHSGLGGASRITAQDMVTALVRAQANPAGRGLRGLLREVVLRDAQGRDMPNHPVKLRAKTGTLNFVSGLAGYATTPAGGDLAFAIFCADVPRRDRLAMDAREQPPGGPEWTRRARILHSRLIERWASLQA